MSGELGSTMRIAIDGPSGSGKSTLGRALARRLGLPYVDTGAMYRAVAFAVDRAGLAPARAGSEDTEGIAAFLERIRLELTADPDAFRIFVDGIDVTGHLRDPAVSRMAARVAAIEAVRAWMVPRQREAARGGAVLEGRDIGTVVLPDADCKFFVTSDEATRMARRGAQLGVDGGGPTVVEEVRERDRMDRSRAHSPLREAEDAVVIDTSGQTVEESLAAMLAEVARRRDEVDPAEAVD